MTKKISITLLFTIVFALTFVTLFGNSQVRAADCDSALVPDTMTIPTSDYTMRVTVDPCTGEFVSVEFCNSTLTTCVTGTAADARWCIDGYGSDDPGNSDVADPDIDCRAWSTVLPNSNALPGAYSNARYYVPGGAYTR